MRRTVEAEWLDELPADDPGARGSRRDLKWLNRIMGHAEIMRHVMAGAMNGTPPRRIVELGAGDGTFLLELAKTFSSLWNRVEVELVDCKDAVSVETRADFANLGWSMKHAAADVFDWLKKPVDEPADIMIANLFLHQFSEEKLAELLALASQRTNFFAACEPRRGALPFALSRLVWFIGCNAVTRHDAPLSVRAGFNGTEISALWPRSQKWSLREGGKNLFCHAFAAQSSRNE